MRGGDLNPGLSQRGLTRQLIDTTPHFQHSLSGPRVTDFLLNDSTKCRINPTHHLSFIKRKFEQCRAVDDLFVPSRQSYSSSDEDDVS